MTEAKKIDELIKIRTEKINEFRDSGIDPYPHNFKITSTIDEINQNESELINGQNEISTAGRIVSIRNMGKVLFLNIQGLFFHLLDLV